MRALSLHIAALVGFALPAQAVTLAECDRRPSNPFAGEARHEVFAGARVGWAEWWSNEGTFVDQVVMDCRSGEFLKTRMVEEHISNRWFDRRAMVREVIATQMAGAPALFSFQRLAEALKGKGRDIEIATAERESCACAAVHPDLKGAKTGFELEE